ncbi:hypothetical protein ACS0TU_06695, partial [Enterobacter hormaechei]
DQENTPIWGEESLANPVKIGGLFFLLPKRTRFNKMHLTESHVPTRVKGHQMLMRIARCNLM